MSSTYIYRVPKEGPIENAAQFRNSYGSAMFIWDSLFKKYCTPTDEYSYVLSEKNFEQIVALQRSERLSKDERICLVTTFDRVMVKREDFRRVADAFSNFSGAYHIDRRVDNLPAMAAFLRSVADDESWYACCWCQTNVASDVWYSERVELDEDGHVVDHYIWDISKDKGHFFLFDEFPELR